MKRQEKECSKSEPVEVHGGYELAQRHASSGLTNGTGREPPKSVSIPPPLGRLSRGFREISKADPAGHCRAMHINSTHIIMFITHVNNEA